MKTPSVVTTTVKAEFTCSVTAQRMDWSVLLPELHSFLSVELGRIGLLLSQRRVLQRECLPQRRMERKQCTLCRHLWNVKRCNCRGC